MFRTRAPLPRRYRHLLIPILACAVVASGVVGFGVVRNSRAASNASAGTRASRAHDRHPHAGPSSSAAGRRSLAPPVGVPAPSTSGAPSSPSAPVTAPPAAKIAKKGVSGWYVDGVTEAIADVGASWFYNWGPHKADVTLPGGVEYVPMIWGPGAVTADALESARKSASGVILGFNEPDIPDQSNMSVQQALDLWPRLEATGARLGSPAPGVGADVAGGWLDRFMAGAKARGYRVDFIAVHWYGSDFSSAEAATGQLRRYLQGVYDRYRLPIWLTEFALTNFGDTGPMYPTPQQQAAFATASTTALEGLSYVERYAWFALPQTKPGDTGLYQGRNPTPAGAAYRATGPSH